MPAAVKLRGDYSAEELRALAKRSKDANQSRRLLSLAAIRDGKERGEAAKIGAMDRQTLRDWVHRFNAAGPDRFLTDSGRPDAERVARPTGRVRKDRAHRQDGSALGGPRTRVVLRNRLSIATSFSLLVAWTLAEDTVMHLVAPAA